MSDYGKKKMAEETISGPVGIWKQNKSEKENRILEDEDEDLVEEVEELVEDEVDDDEEEDQSEQEEDFDDDDDNNNSQGNDVDDNEMENSINDDSNSDSNNIKHKDRESNRKDNNNSNNKRKKKKDGDFQRRTGSVGIVLQEALELSKLSRTQKRKQAKSNESSDVDEIALRQYELRKLRYYFAVATFSSVRAAEVLYNELDGIELEHSSMVFDLRFIPDDVRYGQWNS